MSLLCLIEMERKDVLRIPLGNRFHSVSETYTWKRQRSTVVLKPLSPSKILCTLGNWWLLNSAPTFPQQKYWLGYWDIAVNQQRKKHLHTGWKHLSTHFSCGFSQLHSQAQLFSSTEDNLSFLHCCCHRLHPFRETWRAVVKAWWVSSATLSF